MSYVCLTACLYLPLFSPSPDCPLTETRVIGAFFDGRLFLKISLHFSSGFYHSCTFFPNILQKDWLYHFLSVLSFKLQHAVLSKFKFFYAFLLSTFFSSCVPLLLQETAVSFSHLFEFFLLPNLRDS